MRRVTQSRKGWIVAFVAAAAMAGASTGAQAAPIVWDFTIEALSENDVSWLSPSTLPDGFASYDYTYNVTNAEVRIDLDIVEIWQSIPGATSSGNGSFSGFPTVLISDSVDEGDNAANIVVGINDAGRGYAELTDLQFGTFIGEVTGLRFAGNIQITPVPEPAGVALVGLGVMAIVLRRPRRVA